MLVLVFAFVVTGCGGETADGGSSVDSTATAGGSESEASSEGGERPFSCPVTEAQIREITGLELELEHGADQSLSTPAEALEAEPTIDVLLCGFSAPEAAGPAMVNIHWTESAGRMDMYEVTDHPEWGEEGFVMRIGESEDPSSAVARLSYPGGGYWSITVLVPSDLSPSPDAAAEWAEALGDIISSSDGAAASEEAGTADLSEASLRQQLGASLSTPCSSIDQASTYFEGGGIGASAEEISVEGMDCDDQIVELVHQISPALEDSYWQERVSDLRLDDVGGVSCYASEANAAGGVPVYCDDGRGTRASFTLVHVPEPG